MKIIDGRAFVPYGSLVKKSRFFDVPYRAEMARKKYNEKLPQSAIDGSMEKLLREMDELNIVKAFVPALFGMDGVMENQELVELLEEYGERFEGFAVVYPQDENKLKEIDDYVINGPCTGVVLEPGWGENPLSINDDLNYPIYEKCEANNIPMMLGFGGRLNPNLEMYKPIYLEQILRDFPKLRVVAVHGGWPFAAEMCWLAMMYENFYVMPDVYMCGTPFSDQYAKAANTIAKDKIIYATAYPIVEQKACIKAHINAGLREDVYENVFYKNACRFLGINPD